MTRALPHVGYRSGVCARCCNARPMICPKCGRCDRCGHIPWCEGQYKDTRGGSSGATSKAPARSGG
jgi:hypothetical protein